MREYVENTVVFVSADLLMIACQCKRRTQRRTRWPAAANPKPGQCASDFGTDDVFAPPATQVVGLAPPSRVRDLIAGRGIRITVVIFTDEPLKFLETGRDDPGNKATTFLGGTLRSASSSSPTAP